jgi:hypothetical protein
MPFQDALMIKQMADQIRASGSNEPPPPNNVMQEKLDIISGRAPIQQMPPPPQMGQQPAPPQQDPRMQAGLGAMPAPVMDNAQFATGGIVAFAGDKGSQVKAKTPKWWALPPDLAAVVSNPSFERVAQAVMSQESGGNQDAVSSAGAAGVMQLMPGTIRSPGFGVRPPRNNTAEENYRAGKEYLAAMYVKYGNLEDALRAYNFGFDNYDSFKTGKPTRTGKKITALPTETLNYAPGVFDKLAKAGFNPTALEREIAGGAFASSPPAFQTDVVPTPPSGIPGVPPTPARMPSPPLSASAPTRMPSPPPPARMPSPPPSAPAPMTGGPTLANAAGLPALPIKTSNDPRAMEIFENTLAEDAQRYVNSTGGIGSGMPMLPSTQTIGNAPTTEPTPYAEQPPWYEEISKNWGAQDPSYNTGKGDINGGTLENPYRPEAPPPPPSPAAAQETAPPENGGYEGRAVAPEEYLKPMGSFEDYQKGFKNDALDKYMQLLEGQKASDAKDREYDRRMALANAGFKMAEAAKSNNFMGSLAIGGQEAVKGLSAAKRDADKAQREMDRLLAQMEVSKEDKLNSLYAKYNEAKTARDEKVAEINWRYANTDTDQARAAATARQGALATQIAVSKEGRELLKSLYESPEWAKSEAGLANARTPAVIQGWKDYQKKLEQQALAPLSGAARGAGITANFPTYGTRTVTGE